MWHGLRNRPLRLSRQDRVDAIRIERKAHTLRGTTDAELKSRVLDLRFDIATGVVSRSAKELFPIVVELAQRTLGMRPYRVQIAAGLVLSRGRVAEMQTGEGKTLTASFPLAMHAMRGLPTHLATANDYLARRDAEWLRPLYESLGLSVGFVTSQSSREERRQAYGCDITYGTAREFGFDFLRDRVYSDSVSNQSVFHRSVSEFIQLNSPGGANSQSAAATQEIGDRVGAVAAAGCFRQAEDQRVQRSCGVGVEDARFGFVLVDEADSLLIDEARTPLIISSEVADQAIQEELIRWCHQNVSLFQVQRHLVHDERTGRFEFTRVGYRKLRSLTKPALLGSVSLSEIAEAVTRAVYVEQSLHKDEHYVVIDGEVKIVDEYTGRIAEGRRWRNSIHQAVEAAEGVPLTPLSIHAAKITLPQYFSHYGLVSGMTGTASSAAREFAQVYGMPVVRIPTNEKSRRVTLRPRVFETAEARWNAVADEVVELHDRGRPILIGTRTVQQSLLLSEILSQRSLSHDVLNALNDEEEASIVAQAGETGRITVATNMAGRGTDIKLSDDAREQGGLHVICSELHSSARIDRQLSGRCARQGDPGTCRQFMALDDEVLKEAYGNQSRIAIQRLRSRSVGRQLRAIRKAQQVVETRHERERRLLRHQTEFQIDQHRQLGQDPWLATT